MNCSFAKLTKDELDKCILPFIPKNKRGFSSRFEVTDIFKCIVHKLKTGCQWSCLFVDIECVNPPFSWQTIYYFYRRWGELGVFKEMFDTYTELLQDKLDTEKLNLDGTHSLVKKAAESAQYQHRKRGKTSNVLVMTDGKGIPIAIGDILERNHNDLYRVVPQFSRMIKALNVTETVTKSVTVNVYWLLHFKQKRLILGARCALVVCSTIITVSGVFMGLFLPFLGV